MSGWSWTETYNMSEIRIVVLGKTGVGKSSVANTVFEEKVFDVGNSPNSITSHCKSFTKKVNGRLLKWIDTPGLFDTGRPEEEMKTEILECIRECHPGPHVFLIMLTVGRFTEHEQQVVQKIIDYFSAQALNFGIVLFTHGNELEEGQTILEFVHESERLRRLVQNCGDRCHVVDNKHWVGNQDGYRSNRYQLTELLRTMDEMITTNRRQYYTNNFLQQTIQKILLVAYRLTAGALLVAFLGRAILESSV